jgi:hypothetical protein
MRKIPRLPAELLDSPVGHCCVELVSQVVNQSVMDRRRSGPRGRKVPLSGIEPSSPVIHTVSYSL